MKQSMVTSVKYYKKMSEQENQEESLVLVFRRHPRPIFNIKLLDSRNYLNYPVSNHLILSKEPENKVYRYNSPRHPFTSEVKRLTGDYPSTVIIPSSGLHFNSLWPKCTFALGYFSTAEETKKDN